MEFSGKVQTVLGCIDPSDLGATLTHEHLSINYGQSFTQPQRPNDLEKVCLPITLQNLGWIRRFPYSSKANLSLLTEEDIVIAEVKKFKDAGGKSIVENSTIGLERNMAFLQRVAETTGVNVIAGTGYYFEGFQSASVLALTQEKMFDAMTTDLLKGVEGTGVKCGAIGEVGCSWPLTAWEKTLLHATAAVQESIAGCPVIIHPGRNPAAPAEIVRILQEAGGKINKTVMSHIDRTLLTTEDVLEFARSGCYLEYDLFGIETSHYQHEAKVDMPSDAQRVAFIRHLVDEGFGDKVVIAHDVHTKHRLSHYGGHGYSHILENIVPKMLDRGISQKAVDKILVDNPRNWLTFH